MFVVERVLLKRGKIKNNLSNWETAASVVVERMCLREGRSRKGVLL